MAPKVIRRPAAGHRRTEDGARGEIPGLREELKIGDLVHGEEATYFGNARQFSGKVMEEWRDPSGRYYMVKLLGTDMEALLTWASGTTSYARVHLCPPDSDGMQKGQESCAAEISGGTNPGRPSRSPFKRRPGQCSEARRGRVGRPEEPHGRGGGP